MINTNTYRGRLALVLVCLLVFFSMNAAAEVVITVTGSDGEIISQTEGVTDADATGSESTAGEPAPEGDKPAREALIDDIIALAQAEYDRTGGRAQRAQYSGDIYVCKNFTVYLFKQNAAKYRMAEFPDTPLIIPDNRPKKECTVPTYGVEWKEIPAEEGNPFYIAAQFVYNDDLSKQENRELAREFLKQVKRGDYFQMSADYYYGVGAHSMIYIADYDPETDTVHWCDSNMKGEKRNGERYGYVQFDAVKEIDWFVDAFCHKTRGATLYRLRDDIIYAP